MTLVVMWINTKAWTYLLAALDRVARLREHMIGTKYAMKTLHLSILIIIILTKSVPILTRHTPIMGRTPSTNSQAANS